MDVGCQKFDQSSQPDIRDWMAALLKDQWAVRRREDRDQGAWEFGLVNERAILVTPFDVQDFPAGDVGSHPAHVDLSGFSKLQADVLGITKLVLDPLAFHKARRVVLNVRVGGLHVSDDPESVLRSLCGRRVTKHEEDEE